MLGDLVGARVGGEVGDWVGEAVGWTMLHVQALLVATKEEYPVQRLAQTLPQLPDTAVPLFM